MTYKNVRFVEVPNDRFGMNNAVLYNCGAIQYQAVVSSAIAAGAGAPDPELTAVADKVDDVWSVGQKDVVHYIQLAPGTDMTQFAVNDIVTIHALRTSAFGVTNGVDPLSGKTIQRRVVLIDADNLRLSFDRPVMMNYTTLLTTATYAYVTKGLHIGFVLVLGSRGGIMGNVAQPLKFYEPKPIDKLNCRSVEQFTDEKFENCWKTLTAAKATTQRQNVNVTALKTLQIGQSAAALACLPLAA